MRTRLLIATCTAVVSCGSEESGPGVREKLRAMIKESAPPSPAPPPSTELKESAAPAVVMKPVTVSDSRLIRAVTETLERAEQDRREQAFTPLNGGKIGSIGPMELGSWWSPGEGWSFLRLNPNRTARQVEAAETKMKDLLELARFQGKQRPKAADDSR